MVFVAVDRKKNMPKTWVTHLHGGGVFYRSITIARRKVTLLRAIVIENEVGKRCHWNQRWMPQRPRIFPRVVGDLVDANGHLVNLEFQSTPPRGGRLLTRNNN